jgi:imidazolonepropionase-like amidohydrolase
MHIRRFGRVGAAAAMLAGGTLAVTSAQGSGLVQATDGYFIHDVRVFDGRDVVPLTNVLTDGQLVVAVGPNVQPPPGAAVVDGAGKTLIPGLIDAHTHVFGVNDLRESVLFGVTTELGMGVGAEPFLLALQACTGPSADRADLFGASQIATVPGGHGSQYGSPTLTSPSEAGPYVDARVAEGASYIKMVYDDLYLLGEHEDPWPTLPPPTAKALIDEAHARDLQIVAHATQLDDAQYLAQHGVDGLAHGVVDDAVGSDLAHQLVKHDAFVVATLSVFHAIDEADVATEPLDDPELAPWLTPNALFWLNFPVPPPLGSQWDFGTPLANAGWLHDEGVTLLAGTDTPNITAHGASLHVELELLVAAGLTPSEALTAATADTAEAFELADRGRIAPGLLADLVLVNGDPTTDILRTRDIDTIWRRGTAIDRDAQLALATSGPTPTCP